MNKKSYLFSLFFFVTFALKAQTVNTVNQSLYWVRYYNQLSFNKKVTLHSEIDHRRFFQDNVFNSTFLHFHFHYRVNPMIDFAVGLSYVQQGKQDPNSTKTLIVPEIRPFQEVSFSQNLHPRINLQHRFRLDERFISKNDGVNLLDGSDFNFRMRYRIQFGVSLSKKESNTPTTLKLWDELMVNVGSNIVLNRFDQNRAYVGFEQSFSPSISIEVGYLHLFQQRSTGIDVLDRDVLRFTLYHRMKFK